MFAAFMPLHILLCDEVLPYFVLRVFESKWFEFIKDFKNRKLTRSGL
jgi:hypothetical protein